MYPFYNLTVFKYGLGRYEDRALGEHVILSEGRTVDLKNDCLHYDFKDLDAWIGKHNWYATREVADYYATRSLGQEDPDKLYHEAKKTSKLRDGLYYRLPKFLRAKLYFWYRYLVDAKIYERESKEKP